MISLIVRAILMFAIVAGTVTACDSSPPSTSPPPKPSSSPPVQDWPTDAEEKRWPSIDTMIAHLESEGLNVEVEDVGVGDNADTLKDFATATTPNGQLEIYLFENSAQRDGWRSQIEASYPIVYGPNWIIVCFVDPGLVQGAFGGSRSGASG